MFVHLYRLLFNTDFHFQINLDVRMTGVTWEYVLDGKKIIASIHGGGQQSEESGTI